MKIIILLFFLLAGTIHLHGQEYVPLLDTTKVWNIFENWIYFGNTYPHYLEICETDTTQFIIKKEWHSEHIEELGYLFEDTVSQKVYYTNVNGDEVLLYDFSLSEGDVFEYMLVTKVDSIQLLDGTYRKRIEFEEGYYYYWIEGIGSYMGGLLWTDWFFKKHIPSAWILCYYENDSLLHRNEDYFFDGCDYSFTYVDTETLNKSLIPKIYPNPFTQKVSISFENPVFGEKHEIMIKALDGRVVYKETLNSDISIDLSSLSKGIYLLVLINKDFQYTTKIIKL